MRSRPTRTMSRNSCPMPEFKVGDRVRNRRFGYAGVVRKVPSKLPGCLVSITHVEHPDDTGLVDFTAFAVATDLEHID